MVRTSRGAPGGAHNIAALDNLDVDDLFGDGNDLFDDLDMDLSNINDITSQQVQAPMAPPPPPAPPVEEPRSRSRRKRKSKIQDMYEEDDDELFEEEFLVEEPKKKKKKKPSSGSAKPTTPINVLAQLLADHAGLQGNDFCGMSPSNLFYPFIPNLPTELTLKNRKTYGIIDAIFGAWHQKQQQVEQRSQEPHPLLGQVSDTLRTQVQAYHRDRLCADLYALAALVQKQYSFLLQNLHNLHSWVQSDMEDAQEFLQGESLLKGGGEIKVLVRNQNEKRLLMAALLSSNESSGTAAASTTVTTTTTMTAAPKKKKAPAKPAIPKVINPYADATLPLRRRKLVGVLLAETARSLEVPTSRKPPAVPTEAWSSTTTLWKWLQEHVFGDPSEPLAPYLQPLQWKKPPKLNSGVKTTLEERLTFLLMEEDDDDDGKDDDEDASIPDEEFYHDPKRDFAIDERRLDLSQLSETERLQLAVHHLFGPPPTSENREPTNDLEETIDNMTEALVRVEEETCARAQWLISQKGKESPHEAELIRQCLLLTKKKSSATAKGAGPSKSDPSIPW